MFDRSSTSSRSTALRRTIRRSSPQRVLVALERFADRLGLDRNGPADPHSTRQSDSDSDSDSDTDTDTDSKPIATDDSADQPVTNPEDGAVTPTAPAETAAVLDPETAPTNRSEVLEYGLSPAEYVRLVLEENDGWVPQRQFVETYGWSPSTISRLLSELEDEGVIRRYERDRRKIVCLPRVELPSLRKQ
ncbi:helix-turn-helix transcriptional regulator [Halobiforma nitratireducens]|uniref:DUF7343 domain-containing protein n=1 Tax=Halobiforma nitratireducens JCM 10879 TaxID=1227454 RepID=M0LTE6_9EURY|nr:MarR family transcriptional regulator [Halobiforma nitratireducens]EMA35669.1 hypothetical protein C446_12122 [Halobiforma nitratireducens JCM 10879]